MRSNVAAFSFLFCWIFMSCNSSTEQNKTDGTQTTPVDNNTEKASVTDDMSQKNVVQVAIGSKDHTTLVKAVQAAELVDVLSTTGPFTVFAPTNAAFDKLASGTLENLLKTENKDNLADILQYHVSLGVFKSEILTDGQVIGQVNGGNITITKKDGKIMVNGISVIASIPASNGIIHVIDGVLLPPSNK